MQRKGFTIIELIVAITLFVIVMTLAIGGFVAISRTKTQMNDMKETQQKLRLISEMLVRGAKEADAVSIEESATDKYLRLSYKDASETVVNEKVFSFGRTASPLVYDELVYYDCPVVAPAETGYHAGDADFYSSTYCSHQDLHEGSTWTTYNFIQLDATTPLFLKRRTIPATLDIHFILKNTTANSRYGDDNIEYDNVVILESVR